MLVSIGSFAATPEVWAVAVDGSTGFGGLDGAGDLRADDLAARRDPASVLAGSGAAG
jgi:hypothetical protein